MKTHQTFRCLPALCSIGLYIIKMPGGDPISNVPIRQPDFNWNATNLSQELGTFKRICTSLLDDGPYSELSGKQKVPRS